MSAFVWEDKYSLQIAELDRQHQKLFALFNELYDAMQQGQADEVIDKVLTSVIDYTAYHFDFEEKLLHEAGFREEAAHRAEHAKLAEQAKALAQRLKARHRDTAVPIRGLIPGMAVHFAGCCHPLPGERIVGIVTTGKGVTIHRVTCKNVLNMMSQPRTKSRALDVNWEGSDGFEFMAGIRVTGEDRPGILNDITHAILTYQNTNIRSVNIASQDSLFEGTVMVMVKHIEHLNRLIERVRKIRNVKNVERFEQASVE